MLEERVLSLDISSKTGWNLTISSSEGLFLESFGQVPKISTPDGFYPESYVDWAHLCFDKILELIDRLHPDVLIIEETAANSKTSHSQKILEWIHYLLAKFIKESKIKYVYLLTGQWRNETLCKMTKEESDHNKMVKKYKAKNNSKIAYNESGKRIGKITKKHVAIRRANEVFGKFLAKPLRKKDEDAAESLMLALTYHLRRMKG